MFVIIAGVVQSFCETVAVFVLLPTFDQTTAGIITIYMTCSIPWLLGEILNPKKYPIRITYIIFTTVLFFLSYAIFIRYVDVASGSLVFNSRRLMLVIVILIPFFLSVGFWENSSGIHFEILQKRNIVMIWVSFSKLITTVLTFFVIYGAFGGFRTLTSTRPSTTRIGLLERDIIIFNSLPFGGDCSCGHPFAIAVISITTSYVCYKCSYYVCRTALQIQSFSFPLVLSIISVPVFVCLYLEPDTFYSKLQNCSIVSKDWDFNIEQGNTTHQDLLITFSVFTILCFFCMRCYIWREGVKIELVEK